MISVETLVVAILSGLSGGVLGTWLQIRHEREEAFRERLITAADDLATALQQAIVGLDDAHSACLNHGFLNAQNQLTIRDQMGKIPIEIDDALARSRDLIGKARASSARVTLLFGPVSAPDRAVTLAFHGLEGALSALDGWPGPDLERFSSELSSGRKHLNGFNEQALRDAKGRPWHTRWRWILWIRRQWRGRVGRVAS